MKAAFRSKYCKPQDLKVREVAKPTIKGHEILVKVYATTVNRTDCAILEGKPFIMQFFVGLGKPKSPLVGTDFAGIVEAVGSSVNSFQVGDKVWGFDDLGLNSQAQFMAIDAKKSILKIPNNTTFEQATASAEAAHYAYNFLSKVKFKAGEKVMVHGGTGGIGSAAIQFLKYHGLVVTATCKTESIELVRSIGADRVIDYTQEDFTKDKERYHYVFDAVGKSSFGKCKKILLPKGIYTSSELGDWSQNPFLALITPLFGQKKVVFPVPLDIKRSLGFVKSLLEQHQFKPLIDRIYPLDQIQEAYKYVASGQKIGNVVIRMWDE